MNLKALSICSLFAAATAVTSQIYVPIPPIPMNLALISVFLSGLILGPKYGTISQAIYLLMGVVGLPVFAGFHSGLGYILGPTGGYIVGYVFTTLTIGIMKNKLCEKFSHNVISMLTGLIVCYTLGTAWFIFIMKSSIINALITCVIPFIFTDLIKVYICAIFMNKFDKQSKIKFWTGLSC